MKNTVRNAALAACAALVAAACAKETDVTGPLPEESSDVTYVEIPFTAGLPATKTVLENGEGQERIVKWVKDDEVTIFYGDGKSVTAQAQESGEKTTLVARVPAGDVAAFNAATTYYAVSPASVPATLSGSTLSLSPMKGSGEYADDYGMDGSFGKADICVARSSSEERNFRFQHATSLLKIEVGRNDVKKIQVICGSLGTLTCNFNAGFDEDGVVSIFENKTTSRYASFAPAGPGTYYLPVCLREQSGLAIRYTLTDNSVLPSAVAAKTVTLTRGHILNLKKPEEKIVTDYYFKPGGTGDGSSWAEAGDVSLLRNLFTASQDIDAASAQNLLGYQLTGTIFHFAEGNYILGTEESPVLKVDLSSASLKADCNITFKGGYPAEGGDESERNPQSHMTNFSGNGTFGILYLNGGNLVPSFDVSGINFINGVGQVYNEDVDNGNLNGGGALNIAKAKVTFTDVLFRENTSQYGGGAIKTTSDEAILSLNNCTFETNSDTSGNQLCGGGALCLRAGTVYVKGCSFIRNSSTSTTASTNTRGGAINQPNDKGYGYLFMTDSAFNENQVGQLGASLYNNGANNNTLIFNCSFSPDKNAKKGFQIYANKNVLIANSVVTAYGASSGQYGTINDGITANGYSFMVINTVLNDLNKKEGMRCSNGDKASGTILYYNIPNVAPKFAATVASPYVYGTDNVVDGSLETELDGNFLYLKTVIPDGFTKITQEQLEEKMLSFTPTQGTADGIAAKFVAWLKEVGSWDKDIKGDPRPESGGYYPGCYEVQ